jgi:hypothetical protein
LTALIILGAFFALGRAWRAAAFDRERADAARRQLSATLENAPGIAVQWYDVQGRVLYWNPASEPLYGWSAEEALGKTLDRLFGTPAEAAEFLGLLQETSVTGARVGPTEFRVHNRSGEARCVESTIFTIPGDTPGDTICACMGVDITERKQAEESLNRTEAHYRNLFEDAPVMYTLTLSDGGRPRIADCNILFARTLGYERDAILGRLLEDFYSEESRNALLNEGGYAYALRNPLASVERQLIARDGRQLLTLLSAQPYLDAGGQPIGTRAIFADVSELKRMEVELRASKEAADAASRAKSDFLATMSHEIRTPMNGVLGMTELLLGTELDDQQRRFVQTIRRSAYSLLSIVSDILDFSKIEAGKLKLDIAPFDLAELVQSAADMLEEQAREKGLKLVVRLVPSLPQAVSGDANGLRQVLVNLICNAVKFTEQGEVMVRVLMAEENAETVRFEVKDTGAGIRAMDRDTLFHAFTQGDGSTTRRYGGTGLGLAICRELVELMDGRIGVEDASPSGSLFWFEVALPPARISVIQSVDEAEQTRWAAIDTADDPDRFPRIRARILLAEDNPVNQEVGRSMLEALGCDVVLAADGLAAVQAMQDEDIDLVLMDCHMPGQDGFEATRLIRTREKAEDRVPILALTADVLKGTPELCRAAGMDAYLSKPFNMQVLDDALKKWLPKAPDDSASAAADPEPSASVDGLLDLEVLGRIQALQLPGKPSVIGRVIGLFLESAPDLLEGIRAALSGRDAHALSDRAHSLKSSSANLGAEDLVLLCASLEEAGREKRLDDATVLLNRLEAVFPATLDALRSQLRPD